MFIPSIQRATTAILLAGCGVAASSEPIGCTIHEDSRFVEVIAGNGIALRYHHGVTEVPEGIDPVFERGGYISAVYGLDGTLITEDFPLDHVHHRAVNWSWAATTWHGEMRDMYAIRNPYEGDPIIGGLFRRPAAPVRCTTEDGVAVIEAESHWLWDDEDPIVEEWVQIAVRQESPDLRTIDITLRLLPIVDGLQFAGRLRRDAFNGAYGYSGFNIRMAPGEDQRIRFYPDPEEHDADTTAPRAHADYSAAFGPDGVRAGLSILQHAANPGNPQVWRAYPGLNFIQPIYPGDALIPMPRGEEIILRYRLLVHNGDLADDALAAHWEAYQRAPLVMPPAVMPSAQGDDR